MSFKDYANRLKYVKLFDNSGKLFMDIGKFLYDSFIEIYSLQDVPFQRIYRWYLKGKIKIDLKNQIESNCEYVLIFRDRKINILKTIDYLAPHFKKLVTIRIIENNKLLKQQSIEEPNPVLIPKREEFKLISTMTWHKVKERKK